MGVELLELITAVSYLLQMQLRDPARTSHLGLAPFQARTLSFFARFPERTPNEYASRAGRDKAQVTRVLKELESRELITRSRDPRDGRAIRIQLTEAGKRCDRELEQLRADVAAVLCATISDDEQAQLQRILSKMRDGLELPAS